MIGLHGPRLRRDPRARCPARFTWGGTLPHPPKNKPLALSRSPTSLSGLSDTLYPINTVSYRLLPVDSPPRLDDNAFSHRGDAPQAELPRGRIKVSYPAACQHLTRLWDTMGQRNELAKAIGAPKGTVDFSSHTEKRSYSDGIPYIEFTLRFFSKSLLAPPCFTRVFSGPADTTESRDAIYIDALRSIEADIDRLAR